MNIVAVTSGKGGVGKSCVAAYTGAALAKAGKRVLLAEFGGHGRCLDLIMGMPGTSLFHTGDVAAHACGLEDAAVRLPARGELFLLPAPYAVDFALEEAACRSVLLEACASFDYIVADGLDHRSLPANMMNLILEVATPDTLCVRASACSVEAVRAKGGKEVRLVINNVPASVTSILGAEDFDDVVDMVGARLIAVIPHSPKLAYASNHAEPLGEDSLTPQIFDRLAARILGGNPPLLVR